MGESLVIDNVSKEFSGLKVLKGVSLGVKKNSIHGFLGPNGAGKSTMMNIVAGMIRQTEGKILIFGKEVEPTRRGVFVGLLPEHPPLYFNMTVEKYLRFIVEIFSLSKEVRPEFMEYVIGQCGLGGVLKRIIGNLSMGLRQRTAIAGALVHHPDIMILDEPMVGLDPKSIFDMRNLIKELAENHTIIFSSHQLHEVETLCDSVAILHKGEVLMNDRIETIRAKFTQKKKFVAKVKKWEDRHGKFLMDEGIIHEMSEKKKRGFSQLEFFCKDEKIEGQRVLSKIHGQGVGLFEFYEERPELEDIFQKVTQ